MRCLAQIGVSIVLLLGTLQRISKTAARISDARSRLCLTVRIAPLGLAGNILTAILAAVGLVLTVGAAKADSPSALLAPPSVPVTQRSKSPIEVELQITPTDPRPGETIYWLVRLRNRTSNEIHLVSDIENQLVPKMIFHAPSTNGHAIAGPVRHSQPPSQWVALAPWGILEKSGTVGDLIPECRRGCPRGTLYLDTNFVRFPSDGLQEGYIVVPAAAEFHRLIEIREPVFPYIALRGTNTARVRAIPSPDGRAFRVQWKNQSTHAIWVARPRRWRLDDRFQVHDNGSGFGEGSESSRARWSNEPPMTLNDFVLVGAGETIEKVIPAGPEVRSMSFTLSSPEIPTDKKFEPPFVWDGSQQIDVQLKH